MSKPSLDDINEISKSICSIETCNKYFVGGENTEKIFDMIPGFNREITDKQYYYGYIKNEYGKFNVYVTPLAPKDTIYVCDFGPVPTHLEALKEGEDHYEIFNRRSKSYYWN